MVLGSSHNECSAAIFILPLKDVIWTTLWLDISQNSLDRAVTAECLLSVTHIQLNVFASLGCMIDGFVDRQRWLVSHSGVTQSITQLPVHNENHSVTLGINEVQQSKI